MAGPKKLRKRHIPHELFRHGGKRKGAGRKPKGARAGARHDERPEVNASQALHVVMRVVPAVGSLRRRAMYKAMRGATITATLRERVRIVHISLQRTHVHMLVEAENKQVLGRGIQGFQISAARNINTALGGKLGRRRGAVFVDRYHLVVITSPRQARHALSYVLFNRPVVPRTTVSVSSDASRAAGRAAVVRRVSAENASDGGRGRACAGSGIARRGFVLSSARTWLLRDGRRRAGTISVWDVPSKRA